MDPNTGAKVLFAIIFVLCVLVYKLGFAKKLPLLKAAVVYAVLFFGCSVLTFLGYFLPIAEGLSITALILAVYKVRLHQAKKGRNAA
ncbi:YlaH-like family protein [Metabacillus kandeliae]|uniref:YlaH-like family protein n=1 Tax=Metabacillus kandeliae TaxID=2900151 RepID=UPI0038CC0062